MKALLLLLSYSIRILPRFVQLGLGKLLGLTWFHVFKFRRDVILENLRTAFGKELSEKEILELARKNCIHYGWNLIDFVVSISWTKKQYLSIPLEGGQVLEQALAKGGGAYVICNHLGCWEYGVSSVAARDYPFDVIIKRPRTAWMEKFLFDYRMKSGLRTFAETRTTSEIFGSLGQNRAVGFAIDQFMGPPIGLPVRFFGKLAGTAVALSLFTEKREAPLLLLYNYRDDKGEPRTVIESPPEWPCPEEKTMPEGVKRGRTPEQRTERLYRKTQVFNDMLERIIRKHPEQWLWIHRRWKDYRGEPRWAVPSLTTSLATLLLCMAPIFAGCASNPQAEGQLVSPSGSGVPVEPVVEIPKEAPLQEEAVPEVATPAKTPEKTKPQAKKKATVQQPAAGKKLVRRRFEAQDLPFEVGERQVIALNWTMLPAGSVTMEVRQNADEKFKGRPTFHFWGHVKSSKIVDAMYRINNTIQSYVDKEWFLPYKFLLTMDEKMQNKETRVVFDHPKKKAFYWSDRKSERWGNEVHNREDVIAPNAIDMYSALYYARTLNYKLNQKQEFTVYENNKNLTITLVPVANEVVVSPVGAFQCWKIHTTVHLNNVLQPAGDMFVWLSDDFKKYIVKFDAQLKLGSLKGTLVELRDRGLAGRR